ncbi:MAG: phage late control D family protein, partial [Flavobacteriales bacterium]|nr:phage late control D family protein [Flavobacteriales bacterium]
MNNSGVIQTSKSDDLITFKLLTEGKELSNAYEIKSIGVTKQVNKVPTAKIVLIDGEASSREFKLSNEELLVPGKKIEITAGYHSDEETIFKGIVIKHNVKIRENTSQLIIECKDEAVKMTLSRNSKYFYDSTDSEIIEQLIGDHGLEKDVESMSFQHKELVQYDATDWDFMLMRAQANGKLCFIDDGKITVAKPDVGQSEVETITFGAPMRDFDAEIDARLQVKKVSSFAWNHTDQELLEIEAQDPSVSLNGNITSSDLSDVVNVE